MLGSDGGVSSSSLRPSADGSRKTSGAAQADANEAVHLEIGQEDHVEVGKEVGDGKRVVSIDRTSDR